jgi:titin
LDNGSEITSYNIYVDSVLHRSVDASRFSLVVNGLVTGYEYKFQVTASNGRGESLKSEAAFIYAATEPDTPRSLAKVNADSSEISVDWQAPEDDGGSQILAY